MLFSQLRYVCVYIKIVLIPRIFTWQYETDPFSNILSFHFINPWVSRCSGTVYFVCYDVSVLYKERESLCLWLWLCLNMWDIYTSHPSVFTTIKCHEKVGFSSNFQKDGREPFLTETQRTTLHLGNLFTYFLVVTCRILNLHLFSFIVTSITLRSLRNCVIQWYRCF